MRSSTEIDHALICVVPWKMCSVVLMFIIVVCFCIDFFCASHY